MDRIPDLAFRMMALWFKIYDTLRTGTGTFQKRLSRFGIQPGCTVVDYGCGPGGYLSSASSMVGPAGTVYAVDIHQLAIADLIYALDMFHMLSRPEDVLKECKRLLKPEGRLILDDGHQPRSVTRQKITTGRFFDIFYETERLSDLPCTSRPERWVIKG